MKFTDSAEVEGFCMGKDAGIDLINPSNEEEAKENTRVKLPLFSGKYIFC